MTFVSLFDEDTACSCQNVTDEQNLFVIQRSNQGNCSSSCNGQLCGQAGSIYAYKNEDFFYHLKNCEDKIMFSGLNQIENITIEMPDGHREEVLTHFISIQIPIIDW